jgi:hypothetical protein
MNTPSCGAEKILVVMAGQRPIMSPHRQMAQKGGKNKLMKIVAIIALAAVAFGLGACASKSSAPAPAPAAHGYSK